MTSQSNATESRPRSRRFECLLWAAISLGGALLLVVLLGAVNALSIAVVKVCGTILVYLCAAIVVLALAYAIKEVENGHNSEPRA